MVKNIKDRIGYILAMEASRPPRRPKQKGSIPHFKDENEEWNWHQNEANLNGEYEDDWYKKQLKTPPSINKVKDIHGGSLKTDLIRKIPDNTYTKTAIKKIVKLIRDGTITDIEQFPKPSNTVEKYLLNLHFERNN